MYGDYDTGMIIGMKNKERKYLSIIKKLLDQEPLTAEEKEFLAKQGVPNVQ